MPYFIDLTTKRVVVLPPGADAPASSTEIDIHTAAACELTHDQPLTEPQITALVAGSVEGYLEATTGGTRPPSRDARAPSPVRPRDPRSPTTQRAFDVARVVEALSWALLVVSVVAGLIVAFTTTDAATGRRSHDSVGAGLLLIFFGVFQCLVVIMVAVYIQSRTEQ